MSTSQRTCHTISSRADRHHASVVLIGVLLSVMALTLGCGDSASSNQADTSAFDGADESGDVLVGPDGTDVQGDLGGETDGGLCPADRQCGGTCCNGDRFCFGTFCQDTCQSGIICGETGGTCCAAGRACRPDGSCGLDCAGQGPECGGTCCEPGEVCDAGVCAPDCDAANPCGDVCCADHQQCLSGACVAACADTAKLCGAQHETCCGANQVCLSQQCADLGASCTFTEECEIDQYCEPTLGACVPRDLVDICEFRPPVEAFTAKIGCRWTPPAGVVAAYRGVVMTPVVANLTDDNNDGVTDEKDFPDIAFVAFDSGCCTRTGVLVIVDGRCNDDGVCNAGTCSNGCADPNNCTCQNDDDCAGTMTTLAVLGNPVNGTPWLDNSTGLAVGNLHLDTDAATAAPEIVATGRAPQDVVAWQHTLTGTSCATHDDCGLDGYCQSGECATWTVMWRNTDASGGNTLWAGAHGALPSLTDIEGDGLAEVVIGNVVFDGQSGDLKWDGAALGAGLGVGNNAFLGPGSTVADYDLDGSPEIIAGNTVYGYDPVNGLVEEWTFPYTTSNSSCHTAAWAIPCDGFNAIGNFDGDPEGEIVVVRLGEVFVFDNNRTLLHKAVIPRDDIVPYDGDGPCGYNESGPPTVADFDGDGKPEIGTASADYYVVVDFECTGSPRPAECDQDPNSEFILWKSPNRDCSSRVTGSSVFDFNGDGSAEVIYADETNFRVYNGKTGEVLLDDPSHSSNTRIEMPLVADVDNDGKAEIVVPEPYLNSPLHGGIDIWENDNWVRTRRIWNQHTYHVSNISEAGQVPRVEQANWLHSRLNNFRQNVQPAGIFDAPDLVLELLEIDDTTCPTSGVLTIRVTVSNRGAVGVAPGVNIALSATETASGVVHAVATVRTTTFLLPQQSEVVAFGWAMPSSVGQLELRIDASVDADSAGQGVHNECEEGNNDGSVVGSWVCNVN